MATSFEDDNYIWNPESGRSSAVQAIQAAFTEHIGEASVSVGDNQGVLVVLEGSVPTMMADGRSLFLGDTMSLVRLISTNGTDLCEARVRSTTFSSSTYDLKTTSAAIEELTLSQREARADAAICRMLGQAIFERERCEIARRRVVGTPHYYAGLAIAQRLMAQA